VLIVIGVGIKAGGNAEVEMLDAQKEIDEIRALLLQLTTTVRSDPSHVQPLGSSQGGVGGKRVLHIF
jgi:hypothetical protein